MCLTTVMGYSSVKNCFRNNHCRSAYYIGTMLRNVYRSRMRYIDIWFLYRVLLTFGIKIEIPKNSAFNAINNSMLFDRLG